VIISIYGGFVSGFQGVFPEDDIEISIFICIKGTFNEYVYSVD